MPVAGHIADEQRVTVRVPLLVGEDFAALSGCAAACMSALVCCSSRSLPLPGRGSWNPVQEFRALRLETEIEART
jgi:hypothetical protein